MKILRTIQEMQHYIRETKYNNKSIGFVPTMGYLHEGHQRLLKKARIDNDILILSIFVNPLQFGPNEDLERYPRDEEHDKNIAQQENVDAIFIPSVEEMYPKPLSINLDVNKRANVLCGKSREGHFNGVVTVLTKLFHMVLPDRAYFGLKDAQQLAIVYALVEDYNFPIELVPIPTVREADGLAKSSRNVYLNEKERSVAQNIYGALQHGVQLVKNGEKSKEKIINKVTEFIKSKTHGKIDYVDLLSYPELEAVKVINQRVILATAVQFSQARLIDNIIFEANGELSYPD